MARLTTCGHSCNQGYCTKCHRDRVAEARADGYRKGLEDSLKRVLADPDIEYLGASSVDHTEELLAHVQATGRLPGEVKA